MESNKVLLRFSMTPDSYYGYIGGKLFEFAIVEKNIANILELFMNKYKSANSINDPSNYSGKYSATVYLEADSHTSINLENITMNTITDVNIINSYECLNNTVNLNSYNVSEYLLEILWHYAYPEDDYDDDIRIYLKDTDKILQCARILNML